MPLPWIKLPTDLLENHSFNQLSIQLKWFYIQLLMLAGKCASGGYLVENGMPLNATGLAWRLRSTSRRIEDYLEVISSTGLVEYDADRRAWRIPSQDGSESLHEISIREYWQRKKRNQRESTSPTRTGQSSFEGDGRQDPFSEMAEIPASSDLEGLSPDDPDGAFLDNPKRPFQDSVEEHFQEKSPLDKNRRKSEKEREERGRWKKKRAHSPPMSHEEFT